MNEHMNGQTESENYIPLGINTGGLIIIKYEPWYDKINKMTCVPSEDSDQPRHLPSLISLCCPHEETLGH